MPIIEKEQPILNPVTLEDLGGGEAETDRGINHYAAYLGISIPELLDIVADKDVLDLGAGRGIFATELEMLRGSDLYVPPRTVSSLNRRYAHPRFDDYEAFRKDLLVSLPRIQGARSISLPLSDPIAQIFWKRSIAGRLALDWDRDLSVIPSVCFDVIISTMAFPYYSDLIEALNKEERIDEEIVGGHRLYKKYVVSMDTAQSGRVFVELFRILRPGGEMWLHTDLNYELWKKGNFYIGQNEFISFLAEHQCKIMNVKQSVTDTRTKAMRRQPQLHFLSINLSKC